MTRNPERRRKKKRFRKEFMEEFIVDNMLDDGGSKQIEEYLAKYWGFRKGYAGQDANRGRNVTLEIREFMQHCDRSNGGQNQAEKEPGETPHRETRTG